MQHIDVKRYKEAMVGWIPGPAPHLATFDIFSVKVKAQKVDFLMQIPAKLLEKTLAKSGADGIFNWPRGTDLQQYTVQWLTGPDKDWVMLRSSWRSLQTTSQCGAQGRAVWVAHHHLPLGCSADSYGIGGKAQLPHQRHPN